MRGDDRQLAEDVRLRIVMLLGRKAEMRVSEGPEPVIYTLEGGQIIAVSWERFQDYDDAQDVLPVDAISYAGRGDSFLVTGDGRIEEWPP